MSIEYFKQPDQGLTFDELNKFCKRYFKTLRDDPKYVTECLLPEMIGKEIRDMQFLKQRYLYLLSTSRFFRH